MSQPVYKTAKDKDLDKRGIPLDTLITPDNHKILLTRESLRNIANKISNKTLKKFSASEIGQLVSFINKLPPSKFYNNSLLESQNKIVNAFLLNNTKEETDKPDLDEYQKKEINQMTKNENQYKYSAFADRRGNAVVDFERVDGKKSSAKIPQESIDKENYEALKLVRNFLDPLSISDLINRFSSSYTTFSSINLPHQTIPLDSRHRLINTTSQTEYSWNIHAAGNPGHMGDIKIQDTIQQVIQMNVGSFWLPVLPTVGSYYSKIRMLVKEFTSQSTVVTEFLNSDQTEPTVYYYHFEFDITKTSGNKIFLEPVNKSFTFRKPIARVETITISFRTPFDQLIFTSDRGVFNITYGNPTLFAITSDTAHGLSTGDLVYITNSDSGNLTIDDEINKTAGYFITKTSNTEFSIPLDTSALVGGDTGLNVYYGSKRVFFSLEFVSLEQ